MGKKELMLTEAEIHRQLEHYARQHGLAGHLVSQVVGDVSRVYLDIARRSYAALDAADGDHHAKLEKLHAEFVRSVAQLRQGYNEQTRAVLGSMQQGILALPPPTPTLKERLDNLGSSNSFPLQIIDTMADVLTLGFFRKKR